MRLFRIFAVLFFVFFLPTAFAALTMPAAAVTVRKSMVVSLAEQKLYCMENGRVVYVFPVSTGAGGTPTPTGNFRILYHDYAHPVPKYPGCVCYFWMGFFEDYALHAWPTYNGVQGNYAGLGSPASHGCIRLHPDQAHIPYYWAPNGTPISIIPGRFQQPPEPIRGGHAAAAVREASDRWYFAEGYTGGGFEEYLVVQNPGDEYAVTYCDFMLSDGSVRPFTFTALPHSRMTVHVDALPGLENCDVSVRITSTRPVVAERTVYFGYSECPGGHAELGRRELSTVHLLAEGYTSPFFDTWVTVMNPGNTDTTAAVTFMKNDGGLVPFSIYVPAHSRATLKANDVPGLENQEFSLRVETGEPCLVERVVYFNYPR